MSIRNILIISTLLLSMGTAFAQHSNVPFQRNNRQQRVLDESIDDIAKGYRAGDPWGCYGQTPAWIINHYTTKEELFRLADEHPSVNVRCTALDCIMQKYKGPEGKACFFRHVVESETVKMNGGCVVMYESLGDHLIREASEHNYLSNSEWKMLDSILLASPQATRVKRRNRLLKHLPRTAENETRVRHLAQQGFDLTAVIYLAPYRRPQDTTLVLNIMDSVFSCQPRRYREDWGSMRNINNQMVHLAGLWTHPAFERRLEMWRDSLVMRKGYVTSVFFETALNYDAAWSLAFVEESLQQVAARGEGNPDAAKNMTTTLNHLDMALRDYRSYNSDGKRYGCGGAIGLSDEEAKKLEEKAQRDKKIGALIAKYREQQ